MNKKISLSCLLFLSLACFQFSCNTSASDSNTEHGTDEKSKVKTPGFDFAKPTSKWELPDRLLEISGIVKLDSNKIIAIEDLHPTLYVISLADGKGTITDTIPFYETAKEKFDMEDLALTGKTVYALWSHGSVFKIDNWNTEKKVSEYPTGLDKKNNTEGIAFDPVTGNLLIACKNESGVEDGSKSSRSVYEFDTKTNTLKPDPFLVIEKKDLEKMNGGKVKFYPSAITVHPKTHDIYIISTKGEKCIAQYSHDGKLKSFSTLDASLMPQPEGLCFDSNGNLYISTEGKNGFAPAIYEFAATSE